MDDKTKIYDAAVKILIESAPQKVLGRYPETRESLAQDLLFEFIRDIARAFTMELSGDGVRKEEADKWEGTEFVFIAHARKVLGDEKYRKHLKNTIDAIVDFRDRYKCMRIVAPLVLEYFTTAN